jgi:hypothetical protein
MSLSHHVRYRVLTQGLPKSSQVQDQCAAVLLKFDKSKKDWQLGSTKVSVHHISFRMRM